jgi:serine/threonine-protein kinase
VEFVADLVIADKFRLVRPLGKGGMGAVWLAQHTGLDVPCAVKFIHEEAAKSPELRARFEREAKAAAQLRTPHVVQVLDHGVWQDVPYIAMEYLEGEELGQRLARMGKLSPQEVVSVAVQIGRALTRAHAAGLVHRDLKPGNVFLVRDDEREIAKVLDFGVAKVQQMGVDGTTKTGAILGTPYYMSPEQARGSKDIDHRADLWALSVVVFQCLTGRLPFPGESLGQLFMKIIVEPPPVPSQIAPVPPGFDAWWARATARDPAQRFQTARELGETLSIALGVTVLSGVDVGSSLAIPGNPSGFPLMGSQGGAVAMGGTPMPNAATPAPGTPYPGGMTPSGPMGAAPPGSWSGVAPTPLQQSLSVHAPPPRRGGLIVAVIAAAALGSAGAFFAFRAISHSSSEGPGSSAAPAAADRPSAAVTAPTASAVVLVAEPPPTASALPAAVTAPAAAPDAGVAVAQKRPVAPPASAKPRANCDPNFTLDADGHKHFKPECFK